jgi:hypothetical protein
VVVRLPVDNPVTLAALIAELGVTLNSLTVTGGV